MKSIIDRAKLQRHFTLGKPRKKRGKDEGKGTEKCRMTTGGKGKGQECGEPPVPLKKKKRVKCRAVSRKQMKEKEWGRTKKKENPQTARQYEE